MTTTPPHKRILFRVLDTPDFPRSLWLRLKALAETKHARWIDLLRHAVERYLHDEEHRP